MLDPQPSVWVLEFLLRQPIEDWLVYEPLRALPTPSSLPRSLYITLLLRRLASLLSRRRLSVTLLSSLELLHLLSPRPLPPSLPPAYSACALHLAASLLRRLDPCAFHEIADVFFCRRLGDLENSGMGEGLMSEELKEVKKLVEMAAGGNAEAREDILRRDNEREVVEKVRKCWVAGEDGLMFGGGKPKCLAGNARAEGGKPKLWAGRGGKPKPWAGREKREGVVGGLCCDVMLTKE